MEYRIELELTNCAECGAVFGLIPNYNKTRKEDGKGFYCPNGHLISYGNGENKQLKDKLERAEAQLKIKTNCANQQANTIANQKGQITKLKKQKNGG